MDYKFNKKSWMTFKIFEEHLRKLDRQFRFEKRQVAFILDNCSAHSRLTNLTNITLFFTTKQHQYHNRWMLVLSEI